MPGARKSLSRKGKVVSRGHRTGDCARLELTGSRVTYLSPRTGFPLSSDMPSRRSAAAPWLADEASDIGSPRPRHPDADDGVAVPTVANPLDSFPEIKRAQIVVQQSANSLYEGQKQQSPIGRIGLSA